MYMDTSEQMHLHNRLYSFSIIELGKLQAVQIKRVTTGCSLKRTYHTTESNNSGLKNW